MLYSLSGQYLDVKKLAFCKINVNFRLVERKLQPFRYRTSIEDIERYTQPLPIQFTFLDLVSNDHQTRRMNEAAALIQSQYRTYKQHLQFRRAATVIQQGYRLIN
jgi:hypothetical protein